MAEPIHDYCDPETVSSVAEVVLREDLESLARGYSEEERLELWNDVRSAYRDYIRRCAARLDRDLDKLVRGRFRLAMLLLAASFRRNGEEHPEITGQFREEEYEILEDFEDMKELDYLGVDDIVEFIERREGKVYEVVKKYYERQYHMLDRKWANIMGSMALVFNERYKERRRKIEEAVIKYVRKRPLTLFISEIEDAVRKVVEASRDARRAEERLVKAESLGETIEARLAALEREAREILRMAEESPDEVGRRASRILEEHGDAIERLRAVIAELEEARATLERREAELRSMASRYPEGGASREVLEAEVQALRARIGELEALLDEYRGAVERLEAEKAGIEAHLEELKAALRGEAEGHLVTAEEAWAMEEALVRRVVRNLEKGARIYDPVRGEDRDVRWSTKVYYELYGGGRPSGKGVMLVARRGVLRRRRDVVVDAVTLVHPEAYSEKGWDSRPAGLAELLELLESRVEEAEKGKYYHILIVSSPTGFTSKAVDYVASREFHLNFASKHVTVYLVDPVTGKIYHNPDDAAATANRAIAEPRIPEEKINKVLEYLLSREAKERALLPTPASPHLRLDEVAKATGEDPETVRRAMTLLEEKGVGRVRVASDGTVAFFYERMAG